MLNHRLHIHGIPENDRVHHQIQAACLVNLLFFQVASNFALIGKMDKLPQIVDLLALIELQIDLTTKDWVLDVAQNKNGFLKFIMHPKNWTTE